MSDEDEEMFDFDYMSEEGEDEEGAEIANCYYESKEIIQEEREESMRGFRQVVKMESSPGVWGIKALKQMVKILLKDENYEEAVDNFRELLGYVGEVPQFISEKCLSSLLEVISTTNNTTTTTTTTTSSSPSSSSSSSSHMPSSSSSSSSSPPPSPSSLSFSFDNSLLDSSFCLGGGLEEERGEWGGEMGEKEIDFTSIEQVEKLLYELTLKTLENKKNERLWFKANVHLAKWHFRHGNFGKFTKILKCLYKSCDREDGTADKKKNGQLLLLYSMEIQMHSRTKNYKKIKELHNKAISVKGGVQDPRVMGVIRENGGKMFILDKDYENAHNNFYQAFLCYDDSGSPRRIRCLRYLILSSLFWGSEHELLSKEAKQFSHNPEIIPLLNLAKSYRSNEIGDVEEILKTNNETLSDEFLSVNIYQLLKEVRTERLKKTLNTHPSPIKISLISKELNIMEEEIQFFLLALITNKTIQAKIDQVNNTLVLFNKEENDVSRKWGEDIEGRMERLKNKLNEKK